MKNIFITLCVLWILSSTANGQTSSSNTSKQKRDNTLETGILTPGPSPTSIPAARWIPGPPALPESRQFSYSVDVYCLNQASGNSTSSLINMGIRRRLDEFSVTAEGKIRFGKSFSNSDNIEQLTILSGRITYLESWLQASAGRLDIGDTITPMEYFGSYPTMGIHRVDGAMLVLPIRFSFGIEDYKNVVAPPTALSFFYFPTMFSAVNANLDTTQAFFLGQLRVKTRIEGIQTTLRLNMGGSSSNYSYFSSVNGHLTYSAALDLNFAQDYTLYGEYGVLNPAATNETNVVAFGAKATGIYTFGPFSMDEIVAEMQIPLARSMANPYIGGNGINPSLAGTPQNSFYVSAKTRLKAVFIQFLATNNPGDFTFGRLNSTNTNIILAQSYGPGNEVKSLSMPFQAPRYENWAFGVRTGVEF